MPVRSILVDARQGGFEFGMDVVTPAEFKLSPSKDVSGRKHVYASWSLPQWLIDNEKFQSWARDHMTFVMSFNEFKQFALGFKPAA
jgi:hypothetical protein